MFSIGSLAKKTGVKVANIRYYEHVGLITPATRTQGNQRRYHTDALEQLAFIKHSRELGFSIKHIKALVALNHQPESSCAKAASIAQGQLQAVRERIASLQRLESELLRIAEGCQGNGRIRHCYVMASLADHSRCQTQHTRPPTD